MTAASLHDRHRERLRALDAGALMPVLEGWRPGASGWRRDYGRLQAGDGPWAVAAFTDAEGRELVRVDLHESVPDDRAALPAGVLGAAVLRAPTDDDRLPGLRSVLSSLGDARIVRYRPGQRCTLVGGTPQGRRFVKVAGDAAALQRDAERIWQVALAGETELAVARPHGFDPVTGSFWQGVVAGEPAQPALLAADGPALARRMAGALAGLARSSLDPSVRAGACDQADRSRRTAAGAALRVPHLGERLGPVLAGFDTWHGRLAPRRLVPVHGAPHAHQWLLTPGGGLGLVDFDRVAWGDPELDVATFLAELDSERGLSAGVERFRAAVVEGYRDGGVELDEDRISLYLAHKRLARVRRLCWALRPDGDARAARHLELVEADLAAAGL